MLFSLASLFFRVNGLGDKARADRLIGLASGVMADNAELSQLQTSLTLLTDAFNGPNYTRMLVTMDVPLGGDASNLAVEGLLSATGAVYGQDFGIVGMAMSAYDIGNAFQGDLLRVSLITLAAILIIVAVSFRSFLPRCF
jgi:predicted RND superfamily exporter protein